MYSNLIRLSDYAEKKTLPSAFHEGKTYLCWYADIISTDKMSNRQNVDQTKCRQTKCHTYKMSTDKMRVTPCMQNTEKTNLVTWSD